MPAPTFIVPADSDGAYFQIGLAGTSDPSAVVAATQRMAIRPTITPRQDEYTPDVFTGDFDLPSHSAPGAEWVDWTADCDVYVNELPIFFHSLIGMPTTTVLVASTAWKHVFKTSGTPTRRFLCCEYFDGQISWVLTYAAVTSMNWGWTEAGNVRVRVQGFAQALQTGTMTPSLTIGTEDPYMGWQKSWYNDPVGTAPGTTAWTSTPYGGDFTLDNRTERIHNKDNDRTFGKLSKHRFTGGGTLNVLDTVGVDGSVGPIKYAEYRNRTYEVNRVGFLGPLITGTTYARMDWDFCGRWGPYGRAPYKGAVAAQLGWVPRRDPTLGFGAQISFQNGKASF